MTQAVIRILKDERAVTGYVHRLFFRKRRFVFQKGELRVTGYPKEES
jgi:hypothetical protein